MSIAGKKSMIVDDTHDQLAGLRAIAGLINHMATSSHEASEEELVCVADKLLDCHENIHATWVEVSEAHASEIEALKSELAAVQASNAPPGSPADVERVNARRSLLVNAAKTVLEAMQKDEPGVKPGDRAAAASG
jgi:hypothetical protein